MNKTVRVVLSPEADLVYNDLKAKMDSKLRRSIFNGINSKVEMIKQDSHYGEGISKDKIPPSYVAKYGVKNLFRVQLPQFWRLLYTLTSGSKDEEIIAFIIEIISHEDYNKRFGYKRH